MVFFRFRSRVDATGMSPDQAAALERLTAALEHKPHDLKARRELAELYKAAGRIPDAIAHYQALAGAYAAQGLSFRAIAVCKQILALDPHHDETHTVLAALYAKQDAAAAALQVEMPPAMGAALVVDASMIEGADPVAVPPPAPLSDEGIVGDHGADVAEEVVDAAALAALTVKPEGSVVLDRPDAVPLFSGLSPETFSVLVKELGAWEADPAAVIVSEGEAGDSVFVVVHGGVRVERRGPDGCPIVVATLGPGEFFGEIALIAERPRAATVVATERTELLEIRRQVVDELVILDPHVRDVLDAFCTRRLLEATIKSSPLFTGPDGVVGVDHALVEDVIALFLPRVVPAGTVLVERGQPSGGLYVILSGTADVSARAEIGTVRLKQLGPGDVFGEMSLLSGHPATASVTAATAVRLSVLPASAFHDVQAAHPKLRERLATLSAQREAFNARFLPVDDGARHAGV